MHNQSDYIAVAQLHHDHINQGFLATLGVPFLTLLYEAIDKDKGSVLIVKRIDERVVGFITGTSGLGPVYKQLLFHPYQLLLSLRACIISPTKIYKILELLLMSNKNKTMDNLPLHELLSIVVIPANRGEDHAESLFKSLCMHFNAQGVGSFRIVVGSSLARAHAFYVKMGSTPVKKIQVHKGANSVVYVRECP